jgi:hypothetical protein
MTGRISNGRANATGATRDTRRIERAHHVLTATTISFTNPGTIDDSGSGLARFGAGQRIKVRGSPLNSRARSRLCYGSIPAATA